MPTTIDTLATLIKEQTRNDIKKEEKKKSRQGIHVGSSNEFRTKIKLKMLFGSYYSTRLEDKKTYQGH